MYNQVSYAGRHVILDLYGVNAELLSDNSFWQEILETAVKKSGATLLHSHFHHFGDGYGCTGVVILAESHASIHTWPETGYASIDIYMCGECDPRIASDYIKENVETEKTTETMMYRGTEV